jgi:hypothetical protein
MPNEFIVKNGLIVGGNVVTSGTITINGALAATQSWVTSQAYLTSASLSGYATQSYVTSAIASLVDAAPAALDTLNELAAALGDDASFSTTVTNSIAAKLPLAGGTLTGALLMGNGVAAAANSQPTALSYGLLQAYGTFTLAADTDGTQSEFAIITAGYGVASATAANGLAIGFNTLTWKNNTVWHSGNLTNLNQLSNGPGYITASALSPYLPLAGGTLTGALSGTSATFNGDLTLTANSSYININRVSTAADGVLIYKTAGANRWLLGAWGNTNNTFYLYSYGTGASVFSVDYSTGAATFSSTISSGGNINVGGQLTFTPADARIISGSSTIAINNNANNTNLLLINNSTGNVGIGISSPAYKLDVNGETRLGKLITTWSNSPISPSAVMYSESGYNTVFAGNGQFSTSYLALMTTGNMSYMGGNVGIGTISPSASLQIVGSFSQQIRFGTSTSVYTNLSMGTGYCVFDAINGEAGAGAFDFRDDGVRRMFIDASGNVGIGSGSPSSKLEVSGDAYVSGQFSQGVSIASKIANYGAEFRSNGSSAQIFFGRSGDSVGSGAIGADASNVFAIWSVPSFSRLLVVNQNGNVGIGTTSPGAKLDVNGASGEVLRVSMTNTYVANAGPKLSFWNGSSEELGFVRGVFNETNQGNRGNLLFGTRTSDALGAETKMIILHNGNVGIGTTSPDSKLTVQGSGYVIKALATGSDSVYLQTVNASYDYIAGIATSLGYGLMGMNSNHSLAIMTNGSERMRITSGGNVGIGTSSPAYKLDIGSNTSETVRISAAATSGSTANLLFGSNTIVSQAARIQGIYGGSWDGALAFSTQDAGASDGNRMTEKMRITSSGNVGIGTTAPAGKLSVEGDGTEYSNIVFKQSAAQEHLLYASTNIQYNLIGSGGPVWIWGQQGGSEIMRLNNTGLGIGTSPSYKLDVAGGDVRFVAAASTDALVRIIAANYATEYDARLFLGENDTNGMTIEYDGSANVGFIGMNSSTEPTGAFSKRIRMSRDGSEVSFPVGNVGIGTTSPIAKLHISSSGAPLAAAIQGDSKLVVSGVDGNMDLLSLDDNSTVSNSIGFGRFNSSTGALIHKFGITTWANSGSIGSNTGDRIAFNYGTLADAWSNSELMTIKASGNVGVGTSSPQSRLDLAPPASQSTLSTLGYSANAQLNIRIPNSTGDVGQIVFTNDAAPTAGYASIGVVMTSGAGVGIGDIIMSTKSVGSDAASTERMRINSSGYVGIGTTSPYSLLQVGNPEQTTPAELTIASRYDGGGPILNFRTDHPNNDNQWNMARIVATDDGNYNGRIEFRTTDSSGYTGVQPTTKMVIKASGNVGIGTSAPTTKLEVVGDIKASGLYYNSTSGGELRLDNSYGGGIGYYADQNGHNFYTWGSTGWANKMAITDAGKVGIGTTTPAEELHVIGRGIFDGGSGDSSTDAVVYVTKSNNNDWGLYVNASGLDYGMYARVSPSAGYAIGVNNGTNWTTRITGDGRIYLNEKDTIASYDTWLRLNQSGHYGSGVYTPGVMRADGGFNVSGSTVWHAGNDGSGSGLDADLLDGQNSTEFLRLLSGGAEASLDSYTDNGIRSVSFAGHSQHLLSWNAGGSTGTVQQLFHYGTPNNGWRIRNKTDNTSWSDWGYVVMASSNQGLISGTIATQSWVGSQSYATTSYVTTQINNLINGAPGVLDTLDELAAALGDDSNFATTVTNSIAGKVSKSGDTMTGALTLNAGLNAYASPIYVNEIRFRDTAGSPQSDPYSMRWISEASARGAGNSWLEFQLNDDNNEEIRIYGNSCVGYGCGSVSENLYHVFRADGYAWHAGNLVVVGTISASGYNSGNWDTAYGWGNHASAGYALNSALANYLPLSGGSIGGALTVNGNLTVNGTITENSSIKLKENVETSEGNLEKVVNLRPVTYNKIGSQTKELGLIAEEVAEVYPEFVQYDENGDPIGVHYSRLTAALIGAVKELTNQVQELNKKING